MSLLPYQPKSKAYNLGLSTPDTMAFEIQQALTQVTERYGDIDLFVMNQLQYPDKKSLHKALAAEQVDIVALAIHNVLQGQGAINGDQTGTGKGRTAAAMIRWGILNGYNTVFVTENSTLFTDLYRDFANIDSDDFVPFIINTLSKKEEVKDEDGNNYYVFKNPLFKSRSSAKIQEECAKLAAQEGDIKLPAGYDFVMTSYVQMQSDEKSKKIAAKAANKKAKINQNAQGKSDFVRAFLKGKKSLLIMDESHNAGGLSSINGIFFREMLGYVSGAYYLSATFAKRPDNMPLYAMKTSIQDAGLDSQKLIAEFDKGGVALQEIVASELVKSGQMVRRERSFDGIRVDWLTLAKEKAQHWEMVDEVTSIIRAIGTFQRTHISSIIRDINESVVGAEVKQSKVQKNLGVNQSDYFSKAHNIMYQLMFAIKAQEVADEVIRLLEADKKVVVAFASTFGSFLESLGLSDGDRVDKLDFSLILLRGIDTVLDYTVGEQQKDEEGNFIVVRTKKTLPISRLNSYARAEYEALVERIEEVTTGVSMTPIDYFTNIIESTRRSKSIGGVPASHYRVEECTGRSGRVRFVDGVPTYTRFASDKISSFRDFNNGNADVVLINRTASTGISAHSSEDYADQRQRVMVIAQPELDINHEVQKRGRINRTGQVNLPAYKYISTTVPSERRGFMILKSKLKSLDANTTGNQQSSKGQLDILDFFNVYGGQVIHDYLQEDSAMNAALDDPCYYESEDGNGKVTLVRIPNGDIPRRVTNRVQLLPVAQQEDFYNKVVNNYHEFVNKLKQEGRFDLEIEYKDYEAELEGRWLYAEGTGTPSPFGQDAILHRYKTKVDRKPLLQAGIDRAVSEFYGKKTDREKYLAGLIEDFRVNGTAKHRDGIKKLKEEIAEYEGKLVKEEELLPTLPSEGKNKTETKKFLRKINSVKNRIERYRKRIEEYNESIEENETEWQSTQMNFGQLMRTFVPGSALQFSQKRADNSQVTLQGVVHKLVFPHSGNPYRLSKITAYIYVNNNLVSMSVPLSQAYNIMAETGVLTADKKDDIRNNWDKYRKSNAFEYRYIAVGNILKALDVSKGGKLTKFNTESGDIVNGVQVEFVPRKTEADLLDKAMTHEMFKPAMTIRKLSQAVLRTPRGKQFEIIEDGGMYFYHDSSGEFHLVVASKNGRGVFTNHDLLKLAILTTEEIREGKKIGQFRTKTGSSMYARFEAYNIAEVCKVLGNVSGITVGGKPLPLPLHENKSAAGRYEYRHTKPADKQKRPAQYFVNQRVATDRHPFGSSVYEYPLTAKQKWQFGLVPVYDNISKPYSTWRENLKGLREQRFNDVVKKSKSMTYERAVEVLGSMVFETAHEDGNTEFIFGDFSREDYGKIAYREFVGQAPSDDAAARLQAFSEMLRMELNAK